MLITNLGDNPIFYNKEYSPSDYFNYNDMNELVDKLLLLKQKNSGLYFEDIRYDWDFPVYTQNSFLYLEDIEKLENDIMYMSYDIYQPQGYIKNKIWRKNGETDVYKSLSNEDLNRMITDMNLLYYCIENIGSASVLYHNGRQYTISGERTVDWGTETFMQWSE